MHSIIRRLRAFLRRDRLDDELAEEIGTHIELRRQALIEQGWPPREAAAEARRQFGNVTAAREQSRDQWTNALLTSFTQDVRFGVRMIARAPVLSAIVVLIITRGAGINSAIFVLASGLLRSPDLPNAHGLVWLDDGRPMLGPTYPHYVDYRDRTQAFADLASFAVTKVAVRSGEPPQSGNSRAVLASGNYFETLQVRAAIGRTFGPEDDRPPVGTAIAVVSDGFWNRRFNRDPAVLRQTIELNLKPFTIVGVLPATFKGVRTPDGNPYLPDIWLPMWTLPQLEAGNTHLNERTMWWGLQSIGRLRDGVTLAQARTEIAAVAAAMDQEYPDKRHPRAPWTTHVTGLDPRFLRTNEGRGMAVLLTAALLVLLIACANVAGLLMARASVGATAAQSVTERTHEIGIRMALGAERRRAVTFIIRKVLKPVVIGLVAGLVIGAAAARVLGAVLYGISPFDPAAFSGAVAFLVVATTFAAWLPARRAATVDPLRALRSE